MSLTREPMFNVPAVVVAVLAVMLVLHFGREFVSEDTATWWLLALAFIPARYAGLAAELPGGDLASLTSPVTHMLIHGDVSHLAINAAWLLAFGTVLARRMGALRFLAFAIAGGLAAAALFEAMNPRLAAPMVGASGAIAAMMGGVMRFLFNAIDLRLGSLLRENPAAIPRSSIMQALTDRRVIMASAVFIGLNLITMIGVSLIGEAGAIAWEAHLGGYIFGLLTFGAFDRAAHNIVASNFEVE